MYGGQDLVPHPVPQFLLDLWQELSLRFPAVESGQPPNCINCNLYHDGSVVVGWHADDEHLFDAVDNDAAIVSLSLGATRKFQVKDSDGTVRSIDLSTGDLLVMHGRVQEHFWHRVPQSQAVDPRINLTWRWTRRHSKRDGCPHAAPRHSE